MRGFEVFLLRTTQTAIGS